MSLTLTIPEDIAIAVKNEAQRTGLPEHQLILEGLRMRFLAVDPELQLEFDELEAASDEDFAKWVKENELG